jgi:probable F420-dependent oxidoreductase
VNLSGTGVWSAGLTAGVPGEVVETAAELEELGYSSLWIPSYGPTAFEAIERLLSATTRVAVATGILNVWVSPAEDVADHVARVRRDHGDRFLLGLGVSHAPIVESLVTGAHYAKPLQVMAAYLDALDAAATPVEPASRVIAALGPKMLALAGSRAAGTHPYNVTPEHTAMARHALGPTKQVLPEQAVALTTDAEEARRLGREFLQHYLNLPNYTNNLRRIGFTDEDLADGGSDRLIDGVIAWGDADAIAARVKEHRDAGADSVCIQVVSGGGIAGMTALPRPVWRALAPALTAL